MSEFAKTLARAGSDICYVSLHYSRGENLTFYRIRKYVEVSRVGLSTCLGQILLDDRTQMDRDSWPWISEI